MALHRHYQYPPLADASKTPSTKTQPLVKGLRVGRFYRGINTTFIIYHYDGVLIDAAPSNQWPLVKKFLTPLEPTQLLLTHHHEDHTGNAGNIANTFKIPVFTNAHCAALLKKPFHIPLVRRAIWGSPVPSELNIIDETHRIKTRSNKTIRLITAPGHSDDMSCFLAEDDGILFTGDLYITGRIRYLHTDEDLQAFYNSLNRVIDHDFDVLCCPHRGIVKQGKQALISKRDFIGDFAERCQSMYANGYPIAEIRNRISGKEDFLSYLTAFEFSKLRLVESALLLKV